MKLESVTAYRDRLARKVNALVVSHLTGEESLPIVVPFGKSLPPNKDVDSVVLRKVEAWCDEWEKEIATVPASIECGKPRRLGIVQKFEVPKEIHYQDIRHALEHAGGRKLQGLFSTAAQRLQAFENIIPGALEELAGEWRALGAYTAPEFGVLLSLLKWRQQNLDNTTPPRQIKITGMDTKFIERNENIIRKIMMAAALPPIEVRKETSIWVKVPPDAAAMVSDGCFACYPSRLRQGPIERVLVVENKAPMMDLNPTDGTLIVFGIGRGAADALGAIPWIGDVDLWYWGDCDSFGYLILSEMRDRLPQVQSVLMDSETIMREGYNHEPENARIDVPRDNLHSKERAGLNYLSARQGRLEQEHIRDHFELRKVGLVTSSDETDSLPGHSEFQAASRPAPGGSPHAPH